MAIISAYAPTLLNDEFTKQEFYEALHSVLRSVPCADKLFLMGDFNARVSSDCSTWGDIICKHGIDKLKGNGLRLLNICSEFDPVIANTFFSKGTNSKQHGYIPHRSTGTCWTTSALNSN